MPGMFLDTKYAVVNQLDKISGREQVRQPKSLITQKCSNKNLINRYMMVLGQSELTVHIVLLAL